MSRFYCSRVRFPGHEKRPMDYRQFFEALSPVSLASITLETRRLFPEAMILDTREVNWSDIPDGSPIEESRSGMIHSHLRRQNRP